VPTSVRIIRPHHPLNGKELKVFGQTHRDGILYLILVLPDDSHAFIPVAWTNLQAEHDDTKKNNSTSPTMASCCDLMRAQVVVDSLLRRMSSVKTAIETQKENDNGTNDIVGTMEDNRIGWQSDLGANRSCCQNGCSDKAIAIDGQDCKPKS